MDREARLDSSFVLELIVSKLEYHLFEMSRRP
jgi:hypothetical protein